MRLTNVRKGLGKLNSFPGRGTVLSVDGSPAQLVAMVAEELGVALRRQSEAAAVEAAVAVPQTPADASPVTLVPVSYTHSRAHETLRYLLCRLLLEKKKKKNFNLT